MSEKLSDPSEPEILSTTEARQASPGFPFRILLISLFLVAMAFALIYGLSEWNDDDTAETSAVPNQENLTEVEPAPDATPAE